MEYQVVKEFKDKKDDNFRYKKGDAYPRKDYEPDEDRVKQLLSEDNEGRHESLKGSAIIQKIPPDEKSEFPRHIGGGSYELSNGEKVKGKEAAIDAEATLKAEK